METLQLRYFLAVADHGSFTRGAESVGISQPSISQQIAKLETELGTPLFHRLGKSVELTEVGRRLVPRARDILASLADMKLLIPALAGEASGPLRIGTVPTIAQCVLPPIVKRFVVEHPMVEFTLHEDDRQTLLHQVHQGSLDLAVMSRAMPPEQILSDTLLHEDFVLALPRKHRLTKRRRVRIDDLRKERLVLLDQGAGLPNLILDFFHSHDIEPTIACRSSQLTTVQAMVAAGLGISFVPEMAAIERKGHPCVYRSLTGDRPRREITLIHHRRRFLSPAAREFMQLLRGSVKSARP